MKDKVGAFAHVLLRQRWLLALGSPLINHQFCVYQRGGISKTVLYL